MNLLAKINIYYLISKYSAAPEFMKLRNEKGSESWFASEMSFANNDKYFAVFDRGNIKAITNINSEMNFTDNVVEYYFNHEKTQELIDFIIRAYNKCFPKLKAEKVLNYLKDSETFENSDTPIFILIHDLIHQVLQSNFSESLSNQYDRENEGLFNSLIDELYEDIASTMSNFQPQTKNIGQGIFNYIKNVYSLYKKQEGKDFDVKRVIEKTFHHAKAELRGKIDKFKDSGISNEKIPNEIKQLVDGILSKLKFEMLNQSDSISNDYDVFKNLYIDDIAEDYYQKIIDSKVVNQSDSSMLRAWMQGCLKEMSKLNNYFKHELESEFLPPDSQF